jgi:hypothetical protein
MQNSKKFVQRLQARSRTMDSTKPASSTSLESSASQTRCRGFSLVGRAGGGTSDDCQRSGMDIGRGAKLSHVSVYKSGRRCKRRSNSEPVIVSCASISRYALTLLPLRTTFDSENPSGSPLFMRLSVSVLSRLRLAEGELPVHSLILIHLTIPAHHYSLPSFCIHSPDFKMTDSNSILPTIIESSDSAPASDTDAAPPPA